MSTITFQVNLETDNLLSSKQPYTTTIPSATAWSSATSYIAGNQASSGGVDYLCVVPNKNQAPVTNPGYWKPADVGSPNFKFTRSTWMPDMILNNYKLKNGNQFTVTGIDAIYLLNNHTAPVAWSSATAYVVGNRVSIGGISYTCGIANTNIQPPNFNYWSPTGKTNPNPLLTVVTNVAP